MHCFRNYREELQGHRVRCAAPAVPGHRQIHLTQTLDHAFVENTLVYTHPRWCQSDINLILMCLCFCFWQVLDDKNVRLRFRASNYQSTTRVKPFICTMPMRLDDGWNQVYPPTRTLLPYFPPICVCLIDFICEWPQSHRRLRHCLSRQRNFIFQVLWNGTK